MGARDEHRGQMRDPQRENARDERERREVERWCPYCNCTHMAKVRPAYQFYPDLEARETGLLLVGLAAFGLWHRMLNLMHEAVPRGWLVSANGKAIEELELARLVGERASSVKKLLEKLEGNHVFSRTENGIIYSRRMIRDEHNQNVRAAGGPKSLENPKVPRRKPEPEGYPSDGEKDGGEGYPSGRERISFDALEGRPRGDPSGDPSGYPLQLRSAVAVAAAPALASNSGSGNGSRAAAGEPAPSGRDLPPAAEQFLEHFYGRADESRRLDVRRQLEQTLSPSGAKVGKGKGQYVRAYSAERLESKCREVLAESVSLRVPGSAIVVLLKKLGDTSDGAAPGQQQEVLARTERGEEEAEFATRLAAATEWLRTHTEVDERIEGELDRQRLVDTPRRILRNTLIVKEWRKAIAVAVDMQGKSADELTAEEPAEPWP